MKWTSPFFNCTESIDVTTEIYPGATISCFGLTQGDGCHFGKHCPVSNMFLKIGEGRVSLLVGAQNGRPLPLLLGHRHGRLRGPEIALGLPLWRPSMLMREEHVGRGRNKCSLNDRNLILVSSGQTVHYVIDCSATIPLQHVGFEHLHARDWAMCRQACLLPGGSGK